MDWSDHKTRLRRFLRDPDSNIWDDNLLLLLFNDSQRWLQQQTSLLEEVEAIRVPPMFNQSYMFDWEWSYFNNTEGFNYQCLRLNQQSGAVFSYRWEAGYDLLIEANIGDEGDQFTHPWEGLMDGVKSGSPIPIWFPPEFDRARALYWDRRYPLVYKSKKEIQYGDETWISKKGEPRCYYRLNDVDNCFVLYPAPSSPVWDDPEEEFSSDYNFGYSFDWEDESYLDGNGNKYTVENTTTETEYIFNWENEILNGNQADGIQDDIGTRGIFLFEDELPDPVLDYAGMISDIGGFNFFGDQGGLIIETDGFMPTDTGEGITADVIEDKGNVLLIYRRIPAEIIENKDISDFPRFFTKYVEFDTLERAYSVNNDGKIESLRQYWQFRKQMGLKVVERYKNKRRVDRDYRLTSPSHRGRAAKRRPRLPDTYPPI